MITHRTGDPAASSRGPRDRPPPAHSSAMAEVAGRISIRPARISELHTITALFGALHAHNATLDPRFVLADEWQELLHEHFARTHDDPAALWLLAWAETEPVGLLLVEAHRDSPVFRHRAWAELVALYIEPAHRCQGLASALLHRASAWAAACGFDRLQLYMTASNEQARRFYRRHGMAPVQEIWRLEVTPVPGASQPDDPTCDRQHRDGVDLLEPGHRHLTTERGQEWG
jgi:GNAT superfamily N-acetyltransferase